MIEMQNVTIRAGSFQLDDISFRVEAGDYAVLMGQTGRGKSTILEAICGLRSVTSGSVRLRNEDVTDWAPAERGVGYVPQDLALFPTMSVREHLEFAQKIARRPQPEIDQRVQKLSQELGLEKLLARSVMKLSGGESQRVALGRALSMEPSVLLLDEPFSALDEDTRHEMHTLLKRVTKSVNVTTLHVTHSSEEAAALANRRLVLRDENVHDESEKPDDT